MDTFRAKLPGNGSQGLHQRQYLMSLQRHIGFSYREMAQRSGTMIDRSDLKFTHQAISKWFRGVSQPSEKGREFLSVLLRVSQVEIERHCGIAGTADEEMIPVTVHTVDTNGRQREYHLPLRKDVDLSGPVLVHNWTHIFQQTPGALSRHFKSLSNRLCGYAPLEIRPYINHPRSVVLIETEHKAFDKLEAPNKRLWFACLPDGSLEISPSVITLNPAIRDRVRSGHREWPKT
jgi:transcriptional regulator with XRE-family HTH domain